MNSTFLIGPWREGIRRDSKTWSQPKDSFEILTNAFQFRDRIMKRRGYTLLGNLANGTPVMGLRTMEGFDVDVQTLVAFDLTQAYSYTGSLLGFQPLPSVMPVTWSGTDYQFFYSINYADAFWVTNNKPGLNGVAISGAVPGVGITTITTSTNHGFTSGQSVSLINIGGLSGINGNTYIITVTGLNTFTVPFQATGAYTSGGFALNSQVTTLNRDGIRYYGVLETGNGWANYNPPVDPDNALAGCLLMFAYRGYLVFLNTWEGPNNAELQNFNNRARWTQIGTPYYAHPVPQDPVLQSVDPLAVRDDLFGRGGANDAPTNEAIVAAEFIRDILIVYFERSTWRLRFVNNVQNPFVWERVNKDFGAESTFSAIAFDKGLMAIGNRGIVISDGNDTTRFDEYIPDEIFSIRQSEHGFNRVQGIRTFRTKLNYWTFPSTENPDGVFPDKVLVFNYETKTWSFFDDCFTCFGYFYPFDDQTYTWGDLPNDWSDYTDITWQGAVSQSEFENVIAGNQQGFVFRLEQTSGQNDPSLNISAITVAFPGVFTSTANNLTDGSWIRLSGVTGITSADGVSLNGRNFEFNQVTVPVLSPDDFTLREFKPINGGQAIGATYEYDIDYEGILPYSLQINIGALVFKDRNGDGVLTEAATLGVGTINYTTGAIEITFDPVILSTDVIIRVVTQDPTQGLVPVETDGVYNPGGQIAKISGLDIQTKLFNFFEENKRARLSYVDFYLDIAPAGQFTCSVLADSSNVAINAPLPDNLFSNVVLTSTSPNQVGIGDEAIYRLYADCIAQTVQLQFSYSPQQLAVSAITNSDIQIQAIMMSLRRSGRLP